MPAFLQYAQGLVRHRLARNASWMLLGQGANFFLQAAFFVLLARFLGAREYGVFAGAFALVNVVTPYSTLGTSFLFMRYVTADRAVAPVYWGNMLVLTLIVTVLIGCVFVFLGPLLTNIHNGLLFVVLTVANCLLGQIVGLAGVVFQTFEKLRWMATLNFLSNLARVITVLLMQIAIRKATALQWSFGLLAASGAAALVALIWVRREIGAPAYDLKLIRKRMWEGVGFSFAGTTQAVYNDVDKAMLSHYGLNRENGFYSLAYRIVDFSTSPIAAMDLAVLPSLFRLGHKSTRECARLAFKSAGLAALVGVGIGCCTLLLAPLVPHIVGKDFTGVLVALHWLCWLPVLRGIHRLTGGGIAGSGHQKLRTASQFIVAAVNFLLNLWWIPVFGWIGAAWSSVASDGLLAILNASLLFWLWKNSGNEQIPVHESVSHV